MYLTHVDIHGFKGIKQLRLDLNKDSNVLIGENRWGRSSLLSALMLLSLDNPFYQFIDSDFFYDDKYQADVASIQFKFTESSENELKQVHYSSLAKLAYHDTQLLKKVIRYQIKADKRADKIVTHHYFIDIYGNKMNVTDQDTLIKQLVLLNPVIRLKNPVNEENLPITNQPLSHYYIDQLSVQLTEHSKQFSQHDL